VEFDTILLAECEYSAKNPRSAQYSPWGGQLECVLDRRRAVAKIHSRRRLRLALDLDLPEGRDPVADLVRVALVVAEAGFLLVKGRDAVVLEFELPVLDDRRADLEVGMGYRACGDRDEPDDRRPYHSVTYIAQLRFACRRAVAEHSHQNRRNDECAQIKERLHTGRTRDVTDQGVKDLASDAVLGEHR
jgi:hypothetical protein